MQWDAGELLYLLLIVMLRKLLGNGRGLLAKFKDAASIAACIQTVLENPMRKKRMENKTLAIGKNHVME